MIQSVLPRRGSDKFGSGHYGASRGGRYHRGEDFACYPGTRILSLSPGTCSKIGYPYGDDLAFRYVEVTTERGYKERYFYVEPRAYLEVGDAISSGASLGLSQRLGVRYPDIKEHIHFEVKDEFGRYVNPNTYLETVCAT